MGIPIAIFSYTDTAIGEQTSKQDCVAPDGRLQECFIRNLGNADPINAHQARLIATKASKELVEKSLGWLFEMIRELSAAGAYSINFPFELHLSKEKAAKYIDNPAFNGRIKVTTSFNDMVHIKIGGTIDKYQLSYLKDKGFKTDEGGSPPIVRTISWDI